MNLKDFMKRPNCDKGRHTWSTWTLLESKSYASSDWRIVQERKGVVCSYLQVEAKVSDGYKR